MSHINNHTHHKHSHKHEHNISIHTLLDRLKGNGLKNTSSRKAILEAFLKSHGPHSAEDVYNMLPKRSCDLVTVYRTLLSLVEAKILRSCNLGDRTSRFELASDDDSHHHHLVCTNCKRIDIIDDEEIELIDRFAAKKGYTNIKHTLEFFDSFLNPPKGIYK